MASIDQLRSRLVGGLVIPACPLALDQRRQFDERRQRALVRYYRDAGAGGVAVGVHTTQFAIRDPAIVLYKPVLTACMEEIRTSSRRITAIAGVCGSTPQAVAEAELARGLGYDAVLLSLGALRSATEAELLAHCRSVAAVMPVFGFYLQPAVGGRILPYGFWRRFLEIEDVVGIKIATFNRYQTLDVIRASAESGRGDVALYTGNDDNIVVDLVTPFRFDVDGAVVERRIVGGLLGQWAVWTRKAVELHARCRQVITTTSFVPSELLKLNVQLTDANAALFDVANGFAGCIAGIHEILRRQGLLLGCWCLDPHETLSPGQADEIDRVIRAYPHMTDDAFVAEHLSSWLR